MVDSETKIGDSLCVSCLIGTDNHEDYPYKKKRSRSRWDQEAMSNAKVKFYNPERKFGFLTTEDGDDIYLPPRWLTAQHCAGRSGEDSC